MSRERSLTLKVLNVAAQDLTPAIEELNRQQRRASRVAKFFVVVEHELSGPPEELAIWPGEKNVLYRFNMQHFGEGWGVESGDGTLGYHIHVMLCYAARKGLAKRVFGGWRRWNRWREERVRLLVMDDGVPALFMDRKRYSGDLAGWRQILRDTGWSELQT